MGLAGYTQSSGTGELTSVKFILVFLGCGALAGNFQRRGNFWNALRKTTQNDLIKALYNSPGLDPWAMAVSPTKNIGPVSFLARNRIKNFKKSNKNINSKTLISNAFDADFD